MQVLTKEEAKKETKKLIETYISGRHDFDRQSEADIRMKLIDKLFRLLGWDVEGDEAPDEVQREESIAGRESRKKKADYVFRLYGVPKFVVEAKSLKVDLDNEEFREQAIGYSYNLICPWAVLTNFKSMIIFFVDRDDNTKIRHIQDISSQEKLEQNFEALWMLSKEGVKEGLLQKDIEIRGIKSQKQRADKRLFEDLKVWRKSLSDEIKRKYKDKYKPYEIEEIVQRIIDRLIFIRKLEDMELEPRKLEQIIRRRNEGTSYRWVKSLFKAYREKYNSGLFGEKEEQECDRIDVSDDTIEDVIRGMYKPSDRDIEYNFAAIDADVLGSIYEEYLSFVLKETPKRTKLEGGRAHRKEQGIYYTPTYIVDYIVKNTVSDYIKDKTIDQILDTRILDPACGSGSFLIRAFSEVCRIVNDRLSKGQKSEKWKMFNIYSGKLSLTQKITILTRCIYGVDLDQKAIEIAQLNLLLKLLEGETSETLFRLRDTKKLLPMLDNNIKCGNSLIDDPEVAGADKAFKWEERFKDIMKSGGFDVVIGNPPYVRQEELSDIKPHLQKNYDVYNGTADLFVYFFERELKILRDDGNFGMIVSNKWLRAGYGKNLRRFVSRFWIEEFTDFGDLKIFPDATIYPSIILMRKVNKQNPKIQVCKMDTLNFDSLYSYIKRNSFTVDQKGLGEKEWNIQVAESNELLKKIEQSGIPLEKFIGKKICYGIKTGLNEAFIIDEKTRELIIAEDKKSGDIIKPFLTGAELKRYSVNSKKKYIILTKIGVEINKYPAIKKWLTNFKTLMEKRWDKGEHWYELRACAYYDMFEKPKILWGNLSTKASFAFDNNDFYVNAPACILPTNSKYVLGVLNSKMVSYYLKSICAERQGGFIEQKPIYVSKVPIKKPTSQDQNEITNLADKMLSLNKRLNEIGDKRTDERARIEEEIKKTDKEIDEFVYKIYGITKEEQKIIEESVKY